MDKDIASISFSLVAKEWPIDKFTEEIGIVPTEAYKLGDKYIRGKRESKRFESVWTLESNNMKINYVEDENKEFFESVIKPLRAHIQLINEYKEEYNLTPIFFAHYRFFRAQTPGVRLHPDIITFAHRVGAIMDIYIDKIIDEEE